MDPISAKWKDVWLETILEYVVGWVCGGSRHEVPDVVSGQEVPNRGLTAPPWPELVEAGGRSVDGPIVRVIAPPWPELVDTVGRSVDGIHLGRN